MIGYLKAWDPIRGFGFIARRDDASDVFVHVSALLKSGIAEVRIGDELSFVTTAGREGKLAAADVSVIAQGSGSPLNIEPRRRWAA